MLHFIVYIFLLDRDSTCATFYNLYISQLTCFSRVSSQVSDFNNRNIVLTSIIKEVTAIMNYLKHSLSFIAVIMN